MLVVAGIIGSIPLMFAMAGFALHAALSPEDADGNAERGATVIEKSVENEIPAWATPGDAIPVFLLAIAIVGGVWLWRNQ